MYYTPWEKKFCSHKSPNDSIDQHELLLAVIIYNVKIPRLCLNAPIFKTNFVIRTERSILKFMNMWIKDFNLYLYWLKIALQCFCEKKREKNGC